MTSLAPTASAMDVGGVRALRVGPIGTGPTIQPPSKGGAEAFLASTSWDGRSDSSDDLLKSKDVENLVAVGSEFLLSPISYFQVQATLQTRELKEQTNQSGYERTISSGYWELAAGPAVVIGDLRLAARVTIRGLSDEEREVKSEAGRQSQAIGSAIVPVAEAVAGMDMGSGLLSFGLRTYGGKKVDAKGTTFDGDTVTYETRRQIPAEARIDASFAWTSGLNFGVGVTHVFASQLGTDADEYSLNYVDATDADSRIKTGKAKYTDYFRLDLGATLEANSEVLFIGALRMSGESFADQEFAAVAEGNMGGLAMDIGTYYTMRRIRTFFNLSYLLSSDQSYTNQTTESDDWAATGDEVEVESSGWSLVLGAAYAY